MEIITTLFKYIGGYGPLIFAIFSVSLLRSKQTLLNFYLVGLFLNAILNYVLKGIFQQPRPSVDEKVFNAALQHGKRFIYKDGIPSDLFGMPSGHSESALYSTGYIYFALKNMNITIIYIIFSLIILSQRVYFKYHTVLQVIVGSAVGIVFSYFIYYLAKKNITGLIIEKKDDDGPI
jgi:membrane-associated phospholipid phosphatase